MNWFSRYFRKESQARIVTTIQQVGTPQATPANYEGFAKQGYSKNAIVFICINKIATAASGVDWVLYSGKRSKRGKAVKEITEHPLLTLWSKPNPLQSQASFIEACIAYRLISGNSYIEANRPTKSGPPLELWPVRPDKMNVVPGKNGYPAAYRFKSGQAERLWPVDFVKMQSDIMHWKSFNPINDWYGLSPIEAALLSVDQNSAAQRWNLALLQNSATPSGVLQMKVSDGNPRGELTDEQYKRLKAEFDESYQGARNAGRPMIVEGGLVWSSMSLSPKDMDFLKGREVSAIDVAQIFGVPPEVIGLGQKTFQNYKEARAALYEDTVLPLLDSYRDALNSWLSPAFGDNLYLDYDRDDIEALSYKRDEKFTSLASVNYLTQNEKRKAVDMDEKEGWDVFVIGSQLGEKPEDFESSGFGGGGFGQDDEEGTNDGKPDKPDEPAKPKKPTASDDEQDVDDDRDEGDEKGARGWKSINLLNANEKRTSWKRQNARRKRLADPFTRDLGRDFDQLAKALSEASNVAKDPKLKEFALLRAIDGLMPEFAKTIGKHIGYTFEDFGLMVFEEAKSIEGLYSTKATRKYKEYVERYIKTRTATAITEIEGTTRKQVRKIVKEWVAEAIEAGDSATDLADYLQLEFEALSASRARTIARTEVALASNNASREAVKSLGIPNMVKEWVSADDERTRDDDAHANHRAMNGVEVALDEKFLVPPDASMDGPGDPTAGAEQVIQCRCVLVYKSKN